MNAAAVHAHTGQELASQGHEGQDAARACFLEALRLDRRCSAAWVGLAEGFRAQGQARLAIPCYQEALRQQPASCELLLELGRCLLSVGRASEAVQVLEQAAQQAGATQPCQQQQQLGEGVPVGCGSSNATRATALAMLAEAQYAAGNFRAAIPLFAQYTALVSGPGPPPPEALNNLGNALRGAGRLAEAAQCYAAVCRQLLPASVAAASASSQSPRFHPTAFQSPTPSVLAFCFTSAPMAAPSASLPQPQASGSASPPSLSWLEGLAGWLAPLRGLGSTPSGLAAASTAGMAHTPGSSVHLAPCSGTSAAIPHLEGAMTGATSGAGPAAADPRLGPALSNLGDAYRLQGHDDAALQCYTLAAALQPQLAGAWCRLGTACRDKGQYRQAVQAYSRALALEPEHSEAVAGFTLAKQHICDWSDRERLLRLLERQVQADLQAGRLPQLQPFHVMTLPFSPSLTLALAAAYALDWEAKAVQESGAAGLPKLPHPPADPDVPVLNVGYVSSDLRNHPLGHLMASVFVLHDPCCFRVFLYATSPDDCSEERRAFAAAGERPVTPSGSSKGPAGEATSQQQQQQAPSTQPRRPHVVFRDVSRLTDAQIAQLMSSDGLHVAVDLNGYTKGARPGVFPRRPAPVQASLMGFPASLGAPYLPYMFVDSVVAPKGPSQHRQQQAHEFSEALVRLPHSYFVNNYRKAHPQALSPDFPHPSLATRTSEGLPHPPSVVYCCTNQLYKLDPETLALWLRILRRVPGSVLWLLRFPPEAEHNVRAAAASLDPELMAQQPSRLVFSDVAPRDRHLARCALADVFLDTPWVCGAHTSACDALWAGCPLVTALGPRMAGRVAASLACAVGLGNQMLASDMQGYEELAVGLGIDTERRLTLRRALADARASCALFDTELWVRDLQRGLRLMWQQHCAGAQPEDIDVPNVEQHSR